MSECSSITLVSVHVLSGLLTIHPNRDVIAGMDASQMDESLYEVQWQGEEDYHPFAKGNIELQ